MHLLEACRELTLVDKARLAALTTVMAIGGALGCAQPFELVVVNRSDRAVAFLPGIVVAPCSEAGYTDAQIKEAQRAFEVAVKADDWTWIPPDAEHFSRGVSGQRIGAPKPLTVIISAEADPRAVDRPVPIDEFPACGGDPRGIS